MRGNILKSLEIMEHAINVGGEIPDKEKSQGTTVDRSFVLATKRFDKHLTYVSMSRHREDATIITAGMISRTVKPWSIRWKRGIQNRWERTLPTIEVMKPLKERRTSSRKSPSREKATWKFPKAV